MARRGQDGRRQDEPVGGNDHGVRLQRAQSLMGLRLAQRRRLVYIEALPFGEHLDRARRGVHAAAGGPVGLREDERDIVPGRDQPGEGAFSECRRAGED
jgi:hypothetical protein